MAQSESAPAANAGEPSSTLSQTTNPQSATSISGIVLDQTGSAIAGAHVTLTQGQPATKQETVSGDQGQFSFAAMAPGAFQISVTATGFAAQTISGTASAGESYRAAPITLAVAPESAQVEVVVPRKQIAEAEVKEQEKQRVLGVVPNYYVTYLHDPEPLSPKQKFELAWKTVIDPATFAIVGGFAGVEQAENELSGYGQGGLGYGRRYAATYADTASGTFLGGAILPVLLKQDPRYFYKGTGSVGSRILYALANAVICKGDNKAWQPNYSGMLGVVASGALSNAYYPPANRGVGITFETAALEIGEGAVGDLLEEFVFRKVTPSAPKTGAGKP